MSKRLIITTTNNIENRTIDEYLDLVSSNIVIGSNFFSDFSASVTDVFGGYSGSYQNKLDRIYNNAISDIKNKAILLGADAIVGLKIDFDEISGKGKSMFMVSAVGTAVSLKFKDQEVDNSTIKSCTNNNPPKLENYNQTISMEKAKKDINISKTDDEIENEVIGEILSGNIINARYILMTKQGYSLVEADSFINDFLRL